MSEFKFIAESFVVRRGNASFSVMQLQALCVFHSPLTLAVQFLKHFYLKICTMISDKNMCVINDDGIVHT